MSDDNPVLSGLLPKPEFATAIKKTERTVDRYISRGMPVVRVGQTTYIDPPIARKWFVDGCPAPESTPRRGRRRRAA
jgi:hypothetical protein